jgi:hypothetical protein
MSMCSNLGVPLPYSKYPQGASEQFYYPQESENPMDNLTNSSYAQYFQLTTEGLMPQSWAGSEQQAEGAGGAVTGGSNGWYNYAPTQSGFQRYIRASGSNRMRVMTRNPISKLGIPNPLRTSAPTPLSSGKPWFNDSSYRLDIKDSLGCGPAPPGSD